MKVVILAGGLGTRLSEETVVKPKPMVEVGDMPIIWHIMKIYSHFGFNEFIICLGYKGYLIKEYFANYFLHQSNITIDLSDNSLEIHDSFSEKWKITLIETGLNTMTGGRIKRIKPYINNETFMLTYGDGVGSVNIKELLDLHQRSKKLVTITSVQLSGRFGNLDLNEQDYVLSFKEKPKGDGSWINCGFFVCEPQIFDYISNDDTIWEKEPLEKLASENQIIAHKHRGFWKPMDTLRDKMDLNELWNTGNAEWKLW